MQRDRQEAAFKPERRHARKEWEPSHAEQHQMEGREHARPRGKAHRTHDQRAAEAERHIRRLRARY